MKNNKCCNGFKLWLAQTLLGLAALSIVGGGLVVLYMFIKAALGYDKSMPPEAACGFLVGMVFIGGILWALHYMDKCGDK